MNNRQILTIAVVAVVIIAAGAAAIVLMNNGGKKDSGPEQELITQSWETTLEQADGQSVNMGFYAVDTETKKYLAHLKTEMKELYNIDITLGSSFGPGATKVVKEEVEAGVTTGGTYDLIWGDTSMYKNVIFTDDGKNYDYTYHSVANGKGWVDVLPNSKYLLDTAEDTAKTLIANYTEGSSLEFAGGETMMVNNPDYSAWSVKIGDNKVEVPFNCVVILDASGSISGFIKVCSDDDTKGVEYTTVNSVQIKVADVKTTDDLQKAIDGLTTSYTIKSVRDVVKSNYTTIVGHILYGLPSNFTELLDWSKIYKYQFTYPDATYSAANFHTNYVFSAIMYELTWNSDKTDWTVATDRDANVKSVDSKLMSITTKEQFDKEFGYLYKYLEDLEPYTNKELGHITTGTISLINGAIVGCKDTDVDYNDNTVLFGTTTVASIDMRTTAYDCETAAFALDTACSVQYYLLIPSNSSHKAAAMVVADYMLDPEVQAYWYLNTGNKYNIDVSMTADGDSKDIWNTYFADGVKDWSRYVPADRIAEITVVCKPLYLASFMDTLWKEKIGS